MGEKDTRHGTAQEKASHMGSEANHHDIKRNTT